MAFSEMARAAAHSLRGHQLRSLLTILGIIVGVAAVIVLVGLGDGMTARFEQRYGRMATQIVLQAGGSKKLTDRDVEALRDQSAAPHLATVAPTVSGDAVLRTTTVGVVRHLRSSVTGATSDYLDVLDQRVLVGGWLTENQVHSDARVCVLGSDTVALLFGPDTQPRDVVGRQIRIGRLGFKVIGVLAPSDQSNNRVIVPLGAARSFLLGGNDTVESIQMKTQNAATVDQATEEINAIMDSRHGIRDPADRDYSVVAFKAMLTRNTEMMTTQTLFVAVVAGLSLLVGGVGVANIMLVAVTERTREIGIRKAVGAPRKAILCQFLTEAMALSGTGGVIGVATGLSLIAAGHWALPTIAPSVAPPVMTAAPVLVSFAVSLAIGLGAGIYPAHKAARLLPVEALRFE